MQFQTASTSRNRSKVMSSDQFSQVVTAISEGRYSWACVLILRFAGYNPVHFIPYRTYSRLLKENRMLSVSQEGQIHQEQADKSYTIAAPTRLTASKCVTQINELPHLETLSNQEVNLQGGSVLAWIHNNLTKPDRADLAILSRRWWSYLDFHYD